MKKILLAVLSIAALASCAQDEILGVAKDEAIVFKNAFVDNATKAIDPSITNVGGANAISEFQVWGTTQGDHDGAVIVPIFADEKVDNKAGEWMYSAGKTQYWIDGNKYNFAAVVNGQVASLEKGLPKTIEYTADGTTDLLYARSQENIIGKKSGNEKVGFTFSHLLSKAVFTFKNTTPRNVNNSPANIYEVTNIKIKGLASDADYNVLTGEWVNHNNTLIENFGHIVDAKEKAKDAKAKPIYEQNAGMSNYERLLIPGKYTVTISCTITLYNDKVESDRIVDIINYENDIDLVLEKGVAYNFCLSAGLTETIQFKVDKVEKWNDTLEDIYAPESEHKN